MDATDTTFQMLREMQAQTAKLEEQRQADQTRHEEKLEEPIQVDQERILKMLQEFHLGRASAVTDTLTDRLPTLKIEFKEFSDEPESWNNRPGVHHAQLSVLGCADALTAEAEEDIKIDAGDFDYNDCDPVKLRIAHQAWV